MRLFSVLYFIVSNNIRLAVYLLIMTTTTTRQLRLFRFTRPPRSPGFPGYAAARRGTHRYLRLHLRTADPGHLCARRTVHVHEHGRQPAFGLQEESRILQEDGITSSPLSNWIALIDTSSLKPCNRSTTKGGHLLVLKFDKLLQICMVSSEVSCQSPDPSAAVHRRGVSFLPTDERKYSVVLIVMIGGQS